MVTGSYSLTFTLTVSPCKKQQNPGFDKRALGPDFQTLAACVWYPSVKFSSHLKIERFLLIQLQLVFKSHPVSILFTTVPVSTAMMQCFRAPVRSSMSVLCCDIDPAVVSDVITWLHCYCLHSFHLSWLSYYTVSQKNIPDVFSYNSRKHCRIFIIFGRNVTEKASNHMLLHFPTSPN